MGVFVFNERIPKAIRSFPQGKKLPVKECKGNVKVGNHTADSQFHCGFKTLSALALAIFSGKSTTIIPANLKLDFKFAGMIGTQQAGKTFLAY
jgi:hypothetical protein